MKATYGNYNHDNQPVLLTSMTDTARKESNIVVAIERQMSIRWHIYGSTQAELTTKIEAAEFAYNRQGYDFKLYQDDGNVSAHYMVASTNDPDVVTPNVVGTVNVERFGWVSGVGTQYATRRTAEATLSASVTFDNSESGGGDNQLTSYLDSFTRDGDGDSRVIWKELPNARPVAHTINLTTVARARQSGSASSLSGFVFPVLLYPAFFDGDRSTETKTGPRLVNGLAIYESSWDYQYSGDWEFTADPTFDLQP